jgi:hypothetical protein
MTAFLKKYKYPLTLITFAVISHLQWFNPYSVLNFSDWSYWPNEAVKQLWNSYGTWINFFNFGAVNIQLPFNFFKSIWSLFANLGFSYDLATKITFLIPIAILGFINPYVLFKKLTKNELISFVVALFYGTTTYFLIRQTAHLPVAFVYALVPLIFYLFIRAFEKNKLVNWLPFTLVYWVSICYEIRMTYIVTFIIFLYFLFFYIPNIKNYWKNILLSSLFIIGLNLFWLLPTIFGGFSENISAVANRGLFGNFLFDIKHAFALSDSPWTGGLPDRNFIKQPIIWYLWFVPIIAFSNFLLNRNNKYKKETIFFVIISLIGIFLTKQSDSPLPNAYKWLYENFPGFNLFREASKFYLITAIGYIGLIGYTLLFLKEHKNKILNKYIFTAFIIIMISIAIYNTKPLITNEIGTMFVPKHIPNDYFILKNYILKQPEYFRTFWTPTYSRWGIYTNQKPKISNVNVIGADWKNLLEIYNKNEKLVQNQILNVFKLSFANSLADVSSIKYVIVPIQDKANDDDFFIYYGGKGNPNIRDWYISELDRIEWLKKIDIGTSELVVYENENYRPHLYITKEEETIYDNIDFNKIESKQVNPTQYKIKLTNIKEPIYLNFSESYHPEWKIKVGKFNWFKVLLDKHYFLPDKYHFKNNANLNSFLIDPEYIKQNFDKSYYKENPDGSIDVELVLYFKPQSYFYLGLLISGITLLGCFGYLFYDWKKRRNLKLQVSPS